MLERKTSRILFSSSAVMPFGNSVTYSVSKAQQLSLARALAELTKGTEVTVNSVLIGPVATDNALATLKELALATGVTSEELIKNRLKSWPSYALERRLTPDEMTNIFLFLASKQALLINGTAQRAEAAAIRHI